MSTTKIRIAIAGTLALGVLGSTAATAASAFASGGDDVRKSGACSATGTWKLKAKNDDGALEVEAEVDVNRVGQHWTWRIVDNGTRVANGRAVTVAPSGSFSVNRHIANQAGTDTITFRATNGAGTNTCTGSLSI
jgi:hypothetical protein